MPTITENTKTFDAVLRAAFEAGWNAATFDGALNGMTREEHLEKAFDDWKWEQLP